MNNILLKTIKYKGRVKTTLLLLFCFLMVFSSYAQGIKVSGKVLSETGESLPGVTILEVGTSNGTITDMDGNYSLSVAPDAILKISFIGYMTQEVNVEGRTSIDVNMDPDVQQLEEVVVIGYGTQKKSHLTGAISKVTNENLDQIALSRADQALNGQVSGVLVQTTGQGDNEQGVGAAPTIRIRGTGSVTGGADPLLVIDGVMVDYDFWSSIDMNNVESFEILKDAASASIYGSRGANGVIMITTKSGSVGKTQFSYHGFFGVQDVAKNPDYNMSVAEHVQLEMAAEGELSAQTRYKQLIGVDNNWQDIIFDGGTIQNHSFTARGGNQQTTFNLGFTYMHDEGVMLTDDFKRYSLNSKMRTKVNDRFTFGVNINPSVTQKRRFDGSTHDILRQTPWLPIYHDENTIQYVDRDAYPDVQVGDYAIQRHFDNYDLDGDGTLIDISNTSNTNPFAKIAERNRTDYRIKLFGSIDAEYKIIDGLKLTGSISGTIQDTELKRYQGELAHRNGASNISSNYQNFNGSTVVGQTFLTYDGDFGNHAIVATAGILSERQFNRFATTTGTGYENDLVETINVASEISDASTYERERTLLSYIARVNYAYDDKYLASVSFRRDGASVFGPDKKYGNFPAISVGWRVSEEDFLKGNNLLNDFKIRASYGITGNDNINPGGSEEDRLRAWYSYHALLGSSTYVTDGGNIAAGFNPINVPNPVLAWERSVEINPGVDFGLFGNIITGSFDYYQRTSENLLLDNPVSFATGFGEALVNIGTVENEGFEVELRANAIRGDKFNWSITAIGSRNKNTLTEFGESDGQIQNVDTKRAAEWINQVGHPISSFYGFVTDSEIDPEHLNNQWHPIGAQAQDVYVKDLNGDGVIDDDDKTILGSPYPDFVWSLTNEFTFGNFDLSFMFQGSHGAEVRNMGDQYLYNHFNSRMDYNPDVTPNQEFIQQKIFTDAIVQDASYIALRNVNIGFTLPRDFLSRIKLVNARVYVSGQNLWYMKSDDYTGFNPESITRTSPTTYGYQRAGGAIPRAWTFGVKVDF